MSIRGIFEKLKSLWGWLRQVWNRQPDIFVYQPIRLESTPEPTPFEVEIEGKTVKGFILRQDEAQLKVRRVSHSFALTVPSNWVKHLDPVLKPFLIQIPPDKLGIAYMPVESEGSE